MTIYLKNRIACLAALGILAGCAEVPKLERHAASLDQNIASQRDVAGTGRAADEALLVRVDTPYLAGRTIALAKEAQLPAAFRKASGFVRPSSAQGFTVNEVADLITRNYGIRVRVRPDVFLPASALVPGSGEGAQSGAPAVTPPQVPAGAPMPAPLPTSGGVASAQAAVATRNYDTSIDFDFTGSLSDYLARVSSKLGINWEWSDDDRELVLYRLVRRTFTFDASPVAVSVASTVSKGSNSSTGANSSSNGSTTNSSSSGSISGNSSANLTLEAEAWKAAVATLNKMRTRAGSVEPSPFTRTITMIDTRDVIADAERFMAQQNEIAQRQVLVQVRLVKVTLDRASSFDVDFSAALARAQYTLTGTAASALTGPTGGSLTYAIVNPSSRWSGSQVALQALRELGSVTEEYRHDVPIRNNRSVPVSDFRTFGYLAQTTPAASGSTSTGSGVPGLVPGTVVSGTTMVITPSVTNGDSVSLLISMDRSADPRFTTISTGNGETFQQIQTPQQSGLKGDFEVGMRNNQTLILLDTTKQGGATTTRTGAVSYGESGNSTREVTLMLVTPQIITGG